MMPDPQRSLLLVGRAFRVHRAGRRWHFPQNGLWRDGSRRVLWEMWGMWDLRLRSQAWWGRSPGRVAWASGCGGASSGLVQAETQPTAWAGTGSSVKRMARRESPLGWAEPRHLRGYSLCRVRRGLHLAAGRSPLELTIPAWVWAVFRGARSTLGWLAWAIAEAPQPERLRCWKMTCGLTWVFESCRNRERTRETAPYVSAESWNCKLTPE